MIEIAPALSPASAAVAGTRPPGRSLHAVKEAVAPLAVWCALLALWALLSAVPGRVPGPGDTVAEVWRQISGGMLAPAVAASVLRAAVGYSLALAAGVVFGFLLARSRTADRALGPLVLGLQALPSICWLPLAFLYLGPTEAAILLVVVLSAAFAVTLAVRDGLRSVPVTTLRAAKMLGAGAGPRLWRHVLLPASFPALVSGMRQGWALAWRGLMAAELLSHALRPGVGSLLARGRDSGDQTAMLALVAVILVLGLCIDRLLLAPLDRAVARRWGSAA